jgi:ubiquinone/menaquinone biosynthesis C-methylase UbiE
MLEDGDLFLANIKAAGQSPAAAWSSSYRTGAHRIWDHAAPSTELIGYMLGARLARQTRILDLGCGTGADAIFLADLNFEVHGLDFSAEAIRLAQQRAQECGVLVHSHEGSALNTPYAGSFFDLITDRGCLPYRRPFSAGLRQ